MSPVVNTTVKKTMFPQGDREIKVEPNLDKKDLWHGNKPAFGDLDVIVISSDSESESKPRVKKEDVQVRLRLKGSTVRAKPRGKVRNRAIPVANSNANQIHRSWRLYTAVEGGCFPLSLVLRFVRERTLDLPHWHNTKVPVSDHVIASRQICLEE
jgi:hypothetical protein